MLNFLKRQMLVIYGFRIVIIFGYVMCYPLALVLPYWVSWENQIVENFQVVVLLLGGFFAFTFFLGFAGQGRGYRWFWLMIIPIWFVLFARELSWGAVFLSPVGMDELTGPLFSSSLLWYKPMVYPVIGVLVFMGMAIFIFTKQYRTVVYVWRRGAFPVIEICLAIVGLVLSTAAEEHSGMSLAFLGMASYQLQHIEEFAELLVYLCLFAAQWRVFFGLSEKVLS